MSFGEFTNAMLLLIFSSFVVERSLAVIFESDTYIKRCGGRKILKPLIAIVYSIVFVWISNINLVTIMMLQPVEAKEIVAVKSSVAGTQALAPAIKEAPVVTGWDIKNFLMIIITGIFVAGGSKASLKLFRDVLNIKSAAEDSRKKQAISVPKEPVKAAVKIANGDVEAEGLLNNKFEAFFSGSSN